MRGRPLASLWLVVWMLATSVAWAENRPEPEQLRILPEVVSLTGPEARQRLLVHRFRGELSLGSVTQPVEWKVEPTGVVEIDQGQLIPLRNGQAVVTAIVGKQQATAKVTVQEMDRPWQWSFRNHVQSVLTKKACNSGACHGAAAGKNGFRLSLRGYDAAGDYDVLVRQVRARRVVPSDPGRSLLLLKPTGALPHGGGVRLDVASREYRVVAEWIAQGMPAPQEDDPRIVRLEVLPQQMQLTKGSREPLVVLAHFSDGHTEDVTAWAKYSSTEASVCQVDEQGTVEVMGYGQGAVTVWYLNKLVVARVVVPYPNQVPPQVFAHAPVNNFIDELVLEKLRQLNLPPSPPAGDEEFLRRAYLDTIGVLPSEEEVRRFLADKSPDKRKRLIDQLLAREEFVDYWAYQWSDLLLVNSRKLQRPAMWAYYRWIRDQVAANTPWDQFVWQLVTARGSTLENGAANFYVLHQDPLDAAETVSQAFLGLSINCAKCHNHPLEKWTNDQYFAMANLFGRVRLKKAPGTGHFIVYEDRRGDVIQPLRGKPQPPQPLDGEPLPLHGTQNRREHLARWLTSPQNPYFARAVVNRVWANFMGVGLVEAVDDLRISNPPSNARLLDALCRYLVEHDWDLKALMRLILQSATYQRSSVPLPENQADRRFYARYYPRRLKAEVLLDALSQVTGVPTPFKGYPSGYRALQLPDSNVDNYFLKTFGRPKRETTCACERSQEPSMTQVLHLSNGQTINQKLKSKGNVLQRWLAAGWSDEKILEQLYLRALSRLPAAEEKRRILQALKEAQRKAPRREVLEDLFWSVLTSREFLFNH